GFGVYMQIDTAWSNQSATPPLFYGLLLFGYGLFDEPGAKYQNLRIWPDILEPGALVIYFPVDSATGIFESLENIVMPIEAAGGKLTFQEVWQNPAGPGNWAGTNGIVLEVP
ncbi:MAG: hypothetical protein KJ645_12505, partial [Planctomycetes bacterium]|nr:hypothetical protein [Planctomycetota bacterium]